MSTTSSAKIKDIRDERVPECLHWSCEDVANWVEELGFPYYRDCFLTNLVNGRKLIQVDASALPRLGITDFEHIKVISKGIRDLLYIEEPDWSRRIGLPPRENIGMYLETKSRTGERSDDMTFTSYLLKHEGVIWQPPLANHCLILPHD
ncbi:sterile alpha motif domain-containing protein 15-like [Lineus longissimus]|uniref:sterile alpha motif domain-containing protein 15-like n=1 Tax=Lineus longissimus TaxID=88925 RepID=UPI002B4E96DC